MKNLFKLLFIFILNFQNSLFSQTLSDDLQPYFDAYAQRITLGNTEQNILDYKYNFFVSNSSSLIEFLATEFPTHGFSNPTYIRAGGAGTQTETTGYRGAEGSDLDLNIIIDIDNALPSTPSIDAGQIKSKLKNWLESKFLNSGSQSQYVFTEKDPVIEIAHDTILPNGDAVRYHMDIALFAKIGSESDPSICFNQRCADMAFGTSEQGNATWVGNSSPYFIHEFQQRLPIPAKQRSRDIGKILKFWNKFNNKVPNVDDSTPASIAYLIALYEWYPSFQLPNTAQNMKFVVDNLYNHVFPVGCEGVNSATLNVPFYSGSATKNTLRKLNLAAITKFCNNLNTLKKLLDAIYNNGISLYDALSYLNEIFPDFYPDYPIQKGLYYIKNLETNQYLTVPNASYNDGVNLAQGARGNANTRWEFTPSANGTYRIVSFNSNKYAVIDYGDLISGEPKIIQNSSGTFNTLFHVVDVSNGEEKYKITSYSNYNKYMAFNSQGNAVLRETTLDDSGKWEIIPANYILPTSISLDSPYSIKNQRSGLSLDVFGGSTADNANIIQWPYNGALNQQWKVVSEKYGTVRIKSVKSDKSMIIDNPFVSNGANVMQSSDGLGNARYELIPDDINPNKCKIKNITSGKYVSVHGGSFLPGANVDQWETIGDNGEWVFDLLSTSSVRSTSANNETPFNKAENLINVFPNPSNGTLNITLPKLSSTTNISFYIYDIFGNIIYTETRNVNSEQKIARLELNNIMKNKIKLNHTYILKIISDNGDIYFNEKIFFK